MGFLGFIVKLEKFSTNHQKSIRWQNEFDCKDLFMIKFTLMMYSLQFFFTWKNISNVCNRHNRKVKY